MQRDVLTYVKSGSVKAGSAKSARGSRIESIDMLRGFALVGILFANILWYSGYLDSTSSLKTELLNTTILDESVLYLTRLLVHGKFYFIYSFLFGLGFYILYTRAKDRHPSFNRYFFKRQMVLFLIGCIHAFFIWWGDILRYYALMGLFMVFIKDWQPKHILQLALALLVTPLLLDMIDVIWSVRFELAFAPDASKEVILSNYQENSWFDANLTRILIGLEGNINSGRLIRILGMFVMGYYFGHIGFFNSTEQSKRFQKNLIAFALLVAFPVSLMRTGASYYDYSLSQPVDTLVMELLYIVSVTGMSLGYIAFIAYSGQSLQDTRLGGWLKTLGRVPLTNYLLQSIIGYAIFQGFGLFAEVPLFQAYLISLVMITVQLYLSTEWLKRREVGPVEDLWRRLSS